MNWLGKLLGKAPKTQPLATSSSSDLAPAASSESAAPHQTAPPPADRAESRPPTPSPYLKRVEGTAAPAERSGHAVEHRPQEFTEDELLVALREQLRHAGEHLDRAFPSATVSQDTRDLLRDIVGLDPRVLRRPPPAARVALDAVMDPATPIERVVQIFENDPILAQDLMRQANSAYYATAGGHCESLVGAVQRIGFSGVHGVLLSATVQGMLCRPGGEYQAMVDRVWTHMVRTAPIARTLAPRFGASAEQAFLIGLLHDIGKLAIFDRIAELRAERHASIKLAPSFLSRLLKVMHAPLGGAITLGWNLGAPTARAISTHHRDAVVYDGERMSQVICIAERIDLAVSCRLPIEAEAFWADANLSGEPAQLEEFLALAGGSEGEAGSGEDLEERRAA